MKRIVLSFALLVIAQSGKPSVIEYRLQEPSFAATENAPFQERGRGNGTYTKDSWTVFYRGYEVEGASSSSFEDLGSGYGKDAWKVFYQGLEIEGASPSSFRSFGDGYAKDDWQVFYRGRKIENASSSSFENLGGGYGKDSWTVFYRGKPIPNASVSNAYENDLDELNITYVDLDICLNDFIRLDSSSCTVPFEYNGQMYYADMEQLEKYDAALLSALNAI